MLGGRETGDGACREDQGLGRREDRLEGSWSAVDVEQDRWGEPPSGVSEAGDVPKENPISTPGDASKPPRDPRIPHYDSDRETQER